jgi:CRISPR-associated exonuclease Cas4
MSYLAILLLLLAVVLLWQAARQRRSAGLPGGRVIYCDTRNWGKLERPLYDRALDLTGKPDYLVRQNGQIIPVEVKSGRAPKAPYDAHIFQLASYCLLVEKTYGKRPPSGILHYNDRDFAIDYTPELEFALMDLLADIRRDETRVQVERSHQHVQRCVACGFNAVCDQRLA